MEMENRLVVTRGTVGAARGRREVFTALEKHIMDPCGAGAVPYLACINANILVGILHYRFARGYHWEKLVK